MPIDTDLNIAPYFDDFDETKNFHKVLFRPAVPLQARELTSLQSILQNQIERFGGYQFKEGTIVKGCAFTYDQSIKYAKILDKTQSATPVDVNVALFSKNDYVRTSANLVAQIADTRTGLETQSPNLNTLFFQYINSGTGGETKYTQGQVLEVYPAATPIAADNDATNSGDVIITAMGANYSNSDTVVIASDLHGTAAAGSIQTYAANGSIFKIDITANGTGYSVQDYPTISITRANTQLEIPASLFTGTLQLSKTANVTIANTSFEVAGNSQFNVVGSSYQMSVTDGIVYQKGNFQRFEDQSIIVSPYTSRPHEVHVGIVTTESVVNSSIDTTLLDNASGYNNENAPGADRLKLAPVLTVKTTTEADSSNNFLSLVKFQNGQRISQNQKPVLSDLSDEMASRTYEESGDYVVDPFVVSTEGIVGTGGANNLSIVVGAGVGYVKGHRFQTIGPSRVKAQKGTTFTNAVAQSVSVNFGHYIQVKELKGEFSPDHNDQILILDGPLEALSNNNIDIPIQSSNTVTMGAAVNVVGTARVRGLELDGDNIGAFDSEYQAYIYDIKMYSGKSFKKHAKAVYHYASTEHGAAGNTNTAKRGVADIVLDAAVAEIKDADFNRMVFPVGQNGVKSVGTATFTKKKSTAVTFASANGSASISVSGTELYTFGTDDINLNEIQERQVLVVSGAGVNAAAAVGTSAVVTGTNNIVTGSVTSTLVKGDHVFVGGHQRQVTSIINSTSFTTNKTLAANAAATVLRTFPKDAIIALGDRSTSNAAVSSTGQTLTVNLGVALVGTLAATIVADVKDTSEAGLKKTLATSYVKIDTSSNAGGATGPWCLGIPDALSLTNVYWNESAYSEATADDYSSSFELDNGQKDGYYGLSKLKLKSTSRLTVDANDFIVVKVKHFVKDISAGTGFYSYQSYHSKVDDASASVDEITTQEIPIFVSPTSGRELSLRDCIDFRPNMANTVVHAATLGAANVNPSAVETIDTNNDVASPNELWSATVEYYLPRKDRLVVQKSGFAIVRGVPDVNPSLPQKPDDAMQLATIDVPVYPSLDAKTARFYGRPDLGVKIKATQQRRYTMKDIKVIDERVKNLEYYTSLNMLEKMSSDEVLPGRTDPTQNRFKNGFIVDNFSSVTHGNPLNEEWAAGYDPSRNRLTSKFETYSLQLKYESGSKVTKSGDLVTIRYAQKSLISQPNATQTRRCTSKVWKYNGTLTLYPDYVSDVDHTIAPESAIQIDVDVASPTLGLIAELNKIAPQQLSSERVVSEDITTSLSSSSSTDTTKTDTMETVISQQIERTVGSLSSSSSTTTKAVGDFVSDISFQPYIPAIRIDFVAHGLRPGLPHYLYFDDVDVNAYVTPTGGAASVQFASTENIQALRFAKGAQGTALTSDASGAISGFLRVPAGTFFAGERKVVLADISNLSQIGDVVSKATARFNCYNFSVDTGTVSVSTRTTIPSSSISQNIFNSTERTFTNIETTIPAPVIVIVEANNAVDDTDGGEDEINPPVITGNTVTIPANTAPVITGPAAGTVTIPPRPDFSGENCWDLGWIGGEGGMGGQGWGNGFWDLGVNCFHIDDDPLAQTFMVESTALTEEGSSGYLTSMNLYFATKDGKQGTTVELREVTNGSPGAYVLPFSRVHLTPAQVSTSTNGSAATNITFPSPVIVEAGKEYALVILPDGNSPNYSVYTAKAGQNELTNSSKQVNQDWGKGTMFLSSNNRTWTEYLDEDLKFEIFCAVFTERFGQVNLTNEDHEWVTANNFLINGAFSGGEEVFKLTSNATGSVNFSAGNSSITGSGTNFSSLTAGDRVVLTGNTTTFDVVTVATVSNTTFMTLQGAPSFTDSSGAYMVSPTATFGSLDANTATLMLSSSTASSNSFLFASGDTLIGASSLANTVISTVEDTNISYFEPQLYRSTPSGTTVVPRIKGKKVGNIGTGYSDSDRFKYNDRNYPVQRIKVMSKSNEIKNNAGNKSLTVTHTLSTRKGCTAPSIDLQSQSLVTYENIINNSAANEYLGAAGSAAAKYVSRTVTLANGLDAEDLKVFVNAWKPAGTDVKVYAKMLNQADGNSFADSAWSELQAVVNKDTKSSAVDRSNVVEYSYELADTPVTTIKTGTIATTQGSATITGTNTDFANEYVAGDLIKIVNLDDQTDYIVTSITTVTNATSMVCADTIPFTKIDGARHYKVDTSHKNQVFRDPKAPVAYQATYYNAAGEKFVGYKQLAIKIVMLSDSTNVSPYLRDYRALAVSL